MGRETAYGSTACSRRGGVELNLKFMSGQASGGSWRPTSTLGVFGDSPSPAGPSWPQAEGRFGTSTHQPQTSAMQNGGAQLHYRLNPSNNRAQQTAAHHPLADPRPSSGVQGANSNHQLLMPAAEYRPAGGAPVTNQQLPWNVKPTIAPPGMLFSSPLLHTRADS